MAALQTGWDVARPPRVAFPPQQQALPADETGHSLPQHLPPGQQNAVMLAAQSLDQEVIQPADEGEEMEDERTCPERACAGCWRLAEGCATFWSAWFGAVHLQHLAAEDAEHDGQLDMPRSAAAREVRVRASDGSQMWSNFRIVNPKVQYKKNAKTFSGARRLRRGCWDGEPNPRPEAADFWKHKFGLKDEETMTQRQYWPLFTVLQCVFCFFLWLVISLRDGTVEAGLDSFWPGRTDLTVQWDCVDYRLEVWRWWTYQYTHVGFLHVAMNCIMAILFGISLEGVHGSIRMFIMWNIGVFGGACCYFVADIHTRVVGMSGGVYSLMGMHFGDILMNFDEQWRANKRYTDTFSDGLRSTVQTKWKKMIIPPHWKLLALIVILAIDLVQGFAARSSSTSHSAHFGGFVAGFLICIVVGENLVIKSYEKVLWVLAVVIGLALAAGCVSWGMTWPPQEIFEQVRWCWGRQIANVTVFGDNEWHCVRCADDACIARWARQKYIQAVSDRVCQKNGGWDITER